MCDALVGTWKLTENNSDDFSKCMEEIGVIFMKRQAGRHLDPDVIISKNEDEWSIKTLSTSKNTELNFKLNEEFDEITAEGRKVKTKMTFGDGVLIQKQTWDGEESTITREVKDGRLITTCIIGDVKSVRIYDKE
ncbi:fatty acid-binding protein, adipocyte-like isoform X3 [Bufo bufo]|uniref:fatty acid-binding protein, adipocyte-like isoform X3 n=1 Tax=Bufo bufo TaxID=8384 RepID=UPI001ABE397D|nr:fatty acid-binding protein, adipocyte-like isoform X3 [Bufo bufo]